MLGKGFQDEPQERNPNQTAREMEELAKRPESSAKQARDMEGVSGSKPSQDDLVLPVVPGSKTIEPGKGPLTSNDQIIRDAVEIAEKKGAKEARKHIKDAIDILEQEKNKLQGTARNQTQKRIKELRKAWKVFPRYYPSEKGLPTPLLLGITPLFEAMMGTNCDEDGVCRD